MSDSFLQRLGTYAEAGLLLGVKVGLAILMAGALLGFVLTDYLAVRADAHYAAGVIRATLAKQARPSGEK